MPKRMEDPELFTLPCRLGDSKPFDTLADLGSCVNIIPLDLFKKLKIRQLEETDHVFGLADGTKSYPVGIVRDVEVHIGRLKLLNDFYIIYMKKDPENPLLVGRGFLATANAIIDCRKAKIAVGEGITRPRPNSDGVGAQTPYYARKEFMDCHLPGEWEIARDAEINPFKDVLIVEIILWYFDSCCSKHMTGHRDKLIHFVSKFIGLGHNLFSVGQFCDSDLEVAFRKHTCFVRDLEGVDLLLGSRGSNLYTISMADMMKSSLICLLSKASKTKSWLLHHHLSHLNFGTINELAKQGLVKGIPKLKYTKDHLCSACQIGKSKKESQPHKPKTSTNEKLQMLHMGLCGPMRVESINKKRYILVIVDDYSLFTWVKFLRTKDEAPEIIIKILKQAQVSLNAKELKYLYVFGTLCYPTNDFEDLGKLQPKEDIRIFIGLELQGLTSGHISSGLVHNQAASTLAKPLTNNDWDVLFQPMFDEYFKPPSDVSTPIFAVTLLHPYIAGASPSSTFIYKDALSLSISPKNETISPPINSTNVEQTPNEEVAEFDNDIFTNPFAPPDTSLA
ncbi:retrovirus-related pol polyprotein from transposon TNT 1-94 [Tanacetum coccineum]